MPLPQFQLTVFLSGFYPALASAWDLRKMAIPHVYHPPVADNPVPLRYVFLSLGMELLALAIPLPRLMQQAVAFPAIIWVDWKLLHCGSPSVTASYVIGTAVAYHFFQMLDVFFFSKPATEYVRFDPNVIANVETKKSMEGAKEKSGDDPKKEKDEEEILERNGKKLPKTFSERLAWAWSLLFAMRHIGWDTEAHDELQVPPNLYEPAAFLRERLPKLAFHYISLDLLVYYVRHVDGEYFQPIYNGDSSVGMIRPNPALPSFYPDYPVGSLMDMTLHNLAYFQRITIQALAIWNVISSLYYAVSVIFVGYHLLFRKSNKPGYWTHPRNWPPLFTTFSLTDGLIGFWGKEWHALFRRIYTAPSIYFQLGPQARGLIAFAISGALHACGAWTNSRRGLGSGSFFLVQAAAVSAEALVRHWLKKRGVTVANSILLRMVLSVWGYLFLTGTGRLFFDEYRTGGLWTCDPIPFSIWRGGQFTWAPWSGYGVVW